MVILFVIDNYYLQSNGTTITTKRFVEGLRNNGHEVRILSTGNNIEGLYKLKERFIPIVSWAAKKQDVVFSKPDKKIIKEAINGVDIIHLVTPWKTSRVVRKIAKKLNIPTTASFHIPPESITFGMGLKNARFLNWIIYRKFRRFFNKIPITHVPSSLVADNLRKYSYQTSMKIITNGVNKPFYEINNNIKRDKFKVISIGRYAKEKNQLTILKAINRSKHKNNIKLTLAGFGPWYKKLKRYADRFNLNVKFKFFKENELIKEINHSSIYIHASSIETEGIAALEAIAGGLVPIVSNAKMAATKNLALNSYNKFKENNYKDLAEKLDYLIDNPKVLQKSKEEYQELSQKYQLDKTLNLFEELLKEGIKEEKQYKLTRSLKGKVFAKSFTPSPLKKTFSAMTYYLLALPLLFLYSKIFLNVKYKDLKNFRKVKGGAVVVSNHVHTLDSALNSIAAFPKRPIMTAQPENFDLKIAGFFVSLLGARPTPRNPLETQIFFNKLSHNARTGRFIHVYPEGELIKKDSHLREFKRGAFKLAVLSSVPIIPVKINFETYKFIIWNRQKITLKVGKPIYPDLSIESKEAMDELIEKTMFQMKEL
ncbi:MAG: glycosyltransferase [Acholeplasmataceae bacterium]